MNSISRWGTIFVSGLVAIALASVAFSKKNNTSGVINSGGQAISNTLSAAEAG